jgi:hypothetical protein
LAASGASWVNGSRLRGLEVKAWGLELGARTARDFSEGRTPFVIALANDSDSAGWRL